MPESGKTIASASKVTLHYRILLEDGTEADSSFGEEPLTFRMGEGVLNDGLEEVLVGLAAGVKESITLSPDQAFGWPDTANIHDLPRSDFSSNMMLEPGVIFGFSTPSGEELPGMVLKVDDEKVQVDFNHPLAGHTLQFEVEIIEVE